MAASVALDARKKRVNKEPWSCSGMPIPVSATVSTAESPVLLTVRATLPPLGVYFTAFDRRLTSTRSSCAGSPSTMTS